MSTVSEVRWSERYRRLLPASFSQPLVRNGLALSLSAVLSSVVGFAFWVIAAHRYSPTIVGEDSVAISAFQLIGGISQLNLANGMIRFIPGAGRQRHRLVVGSYALSAVVACVLGLGFLVVVHTAIPKLDFLTSSPLLTDSWVLVTVAWAIFVLEDGALTGLRRATWVPIENTGHGLIKAAALIPLATLAPRSGIYLAWVVATVVTVVVTNCFVFGRAVPAEERRAPDGAVSVAELRTYVPFDYLAALSWLGATSLLPLFVIHEIGAAASAFYALAWVIPYVLYLVSINLGSSMIVEAIADPADLWMRCRQVVGHLLRLIVPCVAVVVVLAPEILRLFGPQYAAAGVPTLRLLAVSALPFVVTATAVSALRVQRRTKLVALINVSLALLVTVFTWLGLRHFGIVAAGIAWLGGQVLVAAAVLGVLATRHARRHGSSIVSASVLAAARALSGSPLVRIGYEVSGRLRSARREQAAERLKDAVLADLAVVAPSVTEGAERFEVVMGGSDLLVICSFGAAGEPLGVIKVPRSDAAARDLGRHEEVLRRLRRNRRLGSWRRLLPRYRVVAGESLRPFALEELKAGVDGLTLANDHPELATELTRRAIEAIAVLHERTKRVVELDPAAVDRMIGPLCRLLREARPAGALPAAQLAAVDRLEEHLRAALTGRTVTLSWVHGDFTPNNVLFDPDTREVAGIVDWGQAQPEGLGVLDAIAWVCAAARLERGVELGGFVRELLDGERWPEIAEKALFLGAEHTGIDRRELALLFWLTHVAGNLEKSQRRYARNPLWWVSNVEPVLAFVAGRSSPRRSERVVVDSPAVSDEFAPEPPVEVTQLVASERVGVPPEARWRPTGTVRRGRRR